MQPLQLDLVVDQEPLLLDRQTCDLLAEREINLLREVLETERLKIVVDREISLVSPNDNEVRVLDLAHELKRCLFEFEQGEFVR